MSDEAKKTPSFSDHSELISGLQAFIADAEALLHASADYRAKARGRDADERVLAQRQFQLAKYHFVTVMGSTLRQLDHLAPLFPAIQQSYDNAKHLRTEGKDLRDMIEHSDQYREGKGRKQKEFVRETVVAGLPEALSGAAVDATSVIVDANGLRLGGRLTVETALAEVKAIFAEAQKLPTPQAPPIAPKPSSQSRDRP